MLPHGRPSAGGAGQARPVRMHHGPLVVLQPLLRDQGRRDAMADPIVFNGTVEWSGENPGVSLKETPDGPFVTLASFFRVVLSPHGRGHALVLLQSPQDRAPPAERANLCLTNNEPMARYLVTEFVSNFGAWK